MGLPAVGTVDPHIALGVVDLSMAGLLCTGETRPVQNQKWKTNLIQIPEVCWVDVKLGRRSFPLRPIKFDNMIFGIRSNN